MSSRHNLPLPALLLAALVIATLAASPTTAAGRAGADASDRSALVARHKPHRHHNHHHHHDHRPGHHHRRHCSRTMKPGARVSRAIARAHGGAILCLRRGRYRIGAANLSKSRIVTVRSAPGGRATVDDLSLTNASGLRFKGLRLRGGISVRPSASRVQFIRNDISGEGGLFLFGDYRIGKKVKAVRIQGNFIHDIDYSGSQEVGFGNGITGIGDTRRVTIRGNTIKRVAGDYIQSATPTDWVVDHNRFLGPSLVFSHPSEHQDLWQIFDGGVDITFTNNIARNTATHESLLFQTGEFRKVRIVNNLFDHDSRGYTCQIYQSAGLVFRRNTVVGSRWGCIFRDAPPPSGSRGPGSRYRIDHNIFVGTADAPDVATEGHAQRWGFYGFNVTQDGSAIGPHSVRHWRPRWRNKLNFRPRGLRFHAGYRRHRHGRH